MKYNIIQGDNRETLKTLADNSVDAVVTDPPYGIDFLGKDWDANTGALETYKECLRVLKPGGYILAFSAARTYHHLAVTLEQAGFEIRDQLMWLYSSGFPKAQDIGKAIQKRLGVEETKEKKLNQYGGISNQTEREAGIDYTKDKERHPTIQEVIPTSPEAQQWAGWKTHLKPAHEPIAMARKPFKGSTIDNVLAHGVGALNIDATRIATDEQIAEPKRGSAVFKQQPNPTGWNLNPEEYNSTYTSNEAGRYPSNVIGKIEGYQKFFYCPKVSRKERHIGFENPLTKTDMLNELGGYYCDKDGNPTNDSNMCYVPGPGKIYVHGLKHEYEKIMGKVATEQSMLDDMNGYYCDSQGNRQDIAGKVVKLPHLAGTIQIHGLKEAYAKWCKANGKTTNVGNNHPTVKPVELMKYLIKLVTPPNSTVLDPFCGSGSTGMAATELGHEFIGCELDPAYVDIAKRRIEAWNSEETDNNFKELFEYVK